MNGIVSFDLFETLVNRRIWPHNSVIWYLADEVKRSFAPDLPVAEFIEQRMEAERIAYRSHRAGYTLSKIYEAFEWAGLPPEVIRKLPAMEAELEIDMVGPIAVNINKLKSYQQAGKRVIIVTDTYLERDTIERIVRKVGIDLHPNDIFISNEHGHLKIKGKLFKAIGQEQNINFLANRHIGNSRGADVHGAIYAGIIPTYFRAGNCNPLEATLTASIDKPNLSMAALIGELRNWRLARLGVSDQAGLRSAIIGFAALAYLSWVIRMCREKGIRRVYFLARDSYILSEIVKLDAFARHEDGIEFRYLYGSRATIDSIWEEEGVHRYLEQEGVFDGVTSALVDVGWAGSFHAKLHKYIVKRSSPPIYGLFIGLEPAASSELSRLRYSIFDQSDVPSKRLKNRFSGNFIYLVEALFQAPYPSTVSYADRDGKVEPVFDNSSVDYTQLKETLSSALEFVERVLNRPDFSLDDPALEVALKKTLTRIALQPSREEAVACGSIRVESDTDENLTQYPLSTPYSILDLGRILSRKQGLSNYRRQWTRGNIQTSGVVIRKIITYLDKNF